MRLAHFLLLFAPHWAAAQCNLTIGSFGVQEDCSNQSVPYAGASWTGGTPPFTVLIVTNTGGGVQVPTGNPFWSGPLFGASLSFQATLTVTDVMGCTASSSVQWVNHVPLPPQVSFIVDCTVGATLRWTGMYTTGVSTAQFSTCPGPFAYNIHNTTTGAMWIGDVAVDWIADPPSAWHFGQALPPGNYAVDIFPISALPGPTCNAGALVECYVPSVNIIVGTSGDCGTNFNLRAALAGALPSGTVMGDQLRVTGQIPATEPYSAWGYTYTGATPGASLQPSLLTVTGSNAILDWVVVELRSPTNSATILYSRPALIQRDGDVVGLNGTSYINTPLAPGNYYVAIRHRNHLGIMTGSARPLALDPSSATIDFRSISLATYGTAARVAVGSVQCMRPGDANGNGTVAYAGAGNDRDLVLQAIGGIVPTNTVNGTYARRDVNLNGTISYSGSNNDRDVILQAIGGLVPTATRTEQLP